VETNVFDKLSEAVRLASENSRGLDGVIQVSVKEISALLKTITDQERELMDFDKNMEIRKEKITQLLDSLSCFDFSKESPPDGYNGDIFEVFVGDNIPNLGRLFVHWDDAAQEFYYPHDEGEEPTYFENVKYWRYPLPEPYESFDVGDL
jgi:hypothetical protein